MKTFAHLGAISPVMAGDGRKIDQTKHPAIKRNGLRIIVSYFGIFAGILILTSCITPGHTSAGYPAIQVLPVLPGETGYHLDDDNYKLALYEGIPASLFVSDARGHYLSRTAFIEAGEIRDAKKNQLPAFAPTPAPVKPATKL